MNDSLKNLLNNNLKKIAVFVAIGIFGLIALTSMIGTQRIDAGYAGIKVNLYGDEKGISDIAAVTGRVWYLKWLTEIHQFPTFTQTVKYDIFFKFNTKDNSVFGFKPQLNYYVLHERVPDVFRQFRKTLPELEQGIIQTTLSNTYQAIGERYAADSLLSNRNKFRVELRQALQDSLLVYGFIIQQISETDTEYPDGMLESITAKNKSIQEKLRADNEAAEAVARGNVKIANARADSADIVIRAKAEAEANRLKQQTLTPLLVQQEWIEAWKSTGGKVPTTMLSDNTTMMFPLPATK